MGIMPKIAIIVPCYNEQKRLKSGHFIDYLDKNKHVSFIFVNDGSTDETLKILRSVQALRPARVKCVSLKINYGKAEAIRQGFLFAIDRSYDIIGFIDADLSTPLNAISSLCELLQLRNLWIVLGSRVMLLGSNISRNAIRHYVGRVFASLAAIVLKVNVYDTQCGAKVFLNNSMLKKIFSVPFRGRWTFDIEILARAKIIAKESLGLSLDKVVHESPLEEWQEIKGSKLKVKDFPIALYEICALAVLLYFPGFRSQYAKLFIGPQAG